MTQKEIIEFEDTNSGVIRLYLEGSFYKAYERSAFAFCTRIKDYKVLRKESKTLGRDAQEVEQASQSQEHRLQAVFRSSLRSMTYRKAFRRMTEGLSVTC